MAVIHVEHVVTCVHCKSENVDGSVNAEGHWYGRCLICGTRFWAKGLHKHP